MVFNWFKRLFCVFLGFGVTTIVPLLLSSLIFLGIAIVMEGDPVSICSTCTECLELFAFLTLLLSMVGTEFDDDPISIRPCGALFSVTGATT